MSNEDFLPSLKVKSEKVKSKSLVCGDPARAGRIGERSWPEL
ncbi:MAG: hypothetical protein ACLFN7_04980 [Candidatus Acetothermia bacterium]